MPETTPPTIRFWRMVDVGAADECWNWTGCTFSGGYGSFTVKARNPHIQLRAHRYSFEIAHGPIPDGMSVCHRCDNRRCVNPAHLFLGSAKDNRQDMIAKGRGNFPRGSTHPCAKLTAEKVVYARTAVAEGRYIKDVADELGVGWSTMTQAVRGATWAHVRCAADKTARQAIPRGEGRKR